MFAIKNIKTGKFLKAFNGSFNKASSHVRYTIAEEGTKQKIEMSLFHRVENVKWEQVVERMWCLKTPNGGQLYKTPGAVAASIGHEDWIEIVPVKVVVDSKRKSKKV